MSEFKFSHRDHLRLAWDVVERNGANLAPAIVGETLRALAAVHGDAGKYNETLTRFWVGVVTHVRTVHPEAGGFEAALAAEPHLLDSSLPFRHWSREALAGGRERWVEPDLLALPLLEKPTS
jgi:hypothetical protein